MKVMAEKYEGTLTKQALYDMVMEHISHSEATLWPMKRTLMVIHKEVLYMSHKIEPNWNMNRYFIIFSMRDVESIGTSYELKPIDSQAFVFERRRLQESIGVKATRQIEAELDKHEVLL